MESDDTDGNPDVEIDAKNERRRRAKAGLYCPYPFRVDGRRLPTCVACKNHGLVMLSRGHRASCPYRSCSCERCALHHAKNTKRSASKHAATQRRKRQQKPSPQKQVSPDSSCGERPSVALSSLRRLPQLAVRPPNTLSVTLVSTDCNNNVIAAAPPAEPRAWWHRTLGSRIVPLTSPAAADTERRVTSTVTSSDVTDATAQRCTASRRWTSEEDVRGAGSEAVRDSAAVGEARPAPFAVPVVGVSPTALSGRPPCRVSGSSPSLTITPVSAPVCCPPPQQPSAAPAGGVGCRVSSLEDVLAAVRQYENRAASAASRVSQDGARYRPYQRASPPRTTRGSGTAPSARPPSWRHLWASGIPGPVPGSWSLQSTAWNQICGLPSGVEPCDSGATCTASAPSRTSTATVSDVAEVGLDGEVSRPTEAGSAAEREPPGSGSGARQSARSVSEKTPEKVNRTVSRPARRLPQCQGGATSSGTASLSGLTGVATCGTAADTACLPIQLGVASGSTSSGSDSLVSRDSVITASSSLSSRSSMEMGGTTSASVSLSDRTSVVTGGTGSGSTSLSSRTSVATRTSSVIRSSLATLLRAASWADQASSAAVSGAGAAPELRQTSAPSRGSAGSCSGPGPRSRSVAGSERAQQRSPATDTSLHLYNWLSAQIDVEERGDEEGAPTRRTRPPARLQPAPLSPARPPGASSGGQLPPLTSAPAPRPAASVPSAATAGMSLWPPAAAGAWQTTPFSQLFRHLAAEQSAAAQAAGSAAPGLGLALPTPAPAALTQDVHYSPPAGSASYNFSAPTAADPLWFPSLALAMPDVSSFAESGPYDLSTPSVEYPPPCPSAPCDLSMPQAAGFGSPSLVSVPVCDPLGLGSVRGSGTSMGYTWAGSGTSASLMPGYNGLGMFNPGGYGLGGAATSVLPGFNGTSIACSEEARCSQLASSLLPQTPAGQLPSFHSLYRTLTAPRQQTPPPITAAGTVHQAAVLSPSVAPAGDWMGGSTGALWTWYGGEEPAAYQAMYDFDQVAAEESPVAAVSGRRAISGEVPWSPLASPWYSPSLDTSPAGATPGTDPYSLSPSVTVAGGWPDWAASLRSVIGSPPGLYRRGWGFSGQSYPQHQSPGWSAAQGAGAVPTVADPVSLLTGSNLQSQQTRYCGSLQTPLWTSAADLRQWGGEHGKSGQAGDPATSQAESAGLDTLPGDGGASQPGSSVDCAVKCDPSTVACDIGELAVLAEAATAAAADAGPLKQEHGAAAGGGRCDAAAPVVPATTSSGADPPGGDPASPQPRNTADPAVTDPGGGSGADADSPVLVRWSRHSRAPKQSPWRSQWCEPGAGTAADERMVKASQPVLEAGSDAAGHQDTRSATPAAAPSAVSTDDGDEPTPVTRNTGDDVITISSHPPDDNQHPPSPESEEIPPTMSTPEAPEYEALHLCTGAESATGGEAAGTSPEAARRVEEPAATTSAGADFIGARLRRREAAAGPTADC